MELIKMFSNQSALPKITNDYFNYTPQQFAKHKLNVNMVLQNLSFVSVFQGGKTQVEMFPTDFGTEKQRRLRYHSGREKKVGDTMWFAILITRDGNSYYHEIIDLCSDELEQYKETHTFVMSPKSKVPLCMSKKSITDDDGGLAVMYPEFFPTKE